MIPFSLIFTESATVATARERAHATAGRLVAFIGIGVGLGLIYALLEQGLVAAYPAVAPLEIQALLFASLLVPGYQLHRRICFASETPHFRAAMRYVTIQLGVLCLAGFFSQLALWRDRHGAHDDCVPGLRPDRRRQLHRVAHLGVFVALSKAAQARVTACALKPKRIC